MEISTVNNVQSGKMPVISNEKNQEKQDPILALFKTCRGESIFIEKKGSSKIRAIWKEKEVALPIALEKLKTKEDVNYALNTHFGMLSSDRDQLLIFPRGKGGGCSCGNLRASKTASIELNYPTLLSFPSRVLKQVVAGKNPYETIEELMKLHSCLPIDLFCFWMDSKQVELAESVVNVALNDVSEKSDFCYLALEHCVQRDKNGRGSLPFSLLSLLCENADFSSFLWNSEEESVQLFLWLVRFSDATPLLQIVYDKGYNFHERCEKTGNNALHEAVHFHHPEYVPLLLSWGVSGEVVNRSKKRPLDIVWETLSYSYYKKPIYSAALFNLLKWASQSYFTAFRRGKNLLHWFFTHDRIGITYRNRLLTLKEKGCPVNEVDENGCSLLDLAMRDNHCEDGEFLLDQMEVSIEIGNPFCAAVLADNPQYPIRWLKKQSEKRSWDLKKLVNRFNDNRETALHIVARRMGGLLIIRQLLSCGALLDVTNYRGKAPCDLAEEVHSPGLVTSFLSVPKRKSMTFRKKEPFVASSSLLTPDAQDSVSTKAITRSYSDIT